MIVGDVSSVINNYLEYCQEHKLDPTTGKPIMRQIADGPLCTIQIELEVRKATIPETDNVCFCTSLCIVGHNKYVYFGETPPRDGEIKTLVDKMLAVLPIIVQGEINKAK